MYWDSMNRIRDRDNISYWMWQSGDALILFLFYFFPQNSLKPESNIFAVRHLQYARQWQFSGFVKFREIGHVNVRDFKFPRCRFFFLCHHSSTNIIFTCH